MTRGEKFHASFSVLVAALTISAFAYMFYDIGQSKATYREQAKTYAKQDAATAGDRIERDCARLEPRGSRECITQVIASAADSQHDQHDLEAQRQMAKWTMWLIIVAAGQLLATSIGLAYIKGTLEATRDAVREAGIATKAAQATAEAYIAVERPRLVVSVSKVVKYSNKTAVTIEIQAENIGKSTGYIHRFAWKESPHNGPPHPLVLKPATQSIHAEKTNFVREIDADLGVRYVSGEIVYRSAFEADHISYFCFRIDHTIPNALGPAHWSATSDKGSDWPEDT